jgi:hypothetical protein
MAEGACGTVPDVKVERVGRYDVMGGDTAASKPEVRLGTAVAAGAATGVVGTTSIVPVTLAIQNKQRVLLLIELGES